MCWPVDDLPLLELQLLQVLLWLRQDQVDLKYPKRIKWHLKCKDIDVCSDLVKVNWLITCSTMAKQADRLEYSCWSLLIRRLMLVTHQERIYQLFLVNFIYLLIFTNSLTDIPCVRSLYEKIYWILENQNEKTSIDLLDWMNVLERLSDIYWLYKVKL